LGATNSRKNESRKTIWKKGPQFKKKGKKGRKKDNEKYVQNQGPGGSSPPRA